MTVLFFFFLLFHTNKQEKIIFFPFSFHLTFLSSKYIYKKYKFTLFFFTKLSSFFLISFLHLNKTLMCIYKTLIWYHLNIKISLFCSAFENFYWHDYKEPAQPTWRRLPWLGQCLDPDVWNTTLNSNQLFGDRPVGTTIWNLNKLGPNEPTVTLANQGLGLVQILDPTIWTFWRCITTLKRKGWHPARQHWWVASMTKRCSYLNFWFN